MSNHGEGLSLARLLMVLSSMSPLFFLWAFKGVNIEGVPEVYFLGFCLFFVLVPNLFLWWRIRRVKKCNDKREITAGAAEDQRDHLLVYLFAMLLPFYSVNIETVRDFSSHLAAIAFIVFLFWHLNMHYMNIFWAFHGYRVYTLSPCDDGNPFSGRLPTVLITKRTHIIKGEKISAYRLSQTVFLEESK
ncbi:MAG: hypothetical protein CO186_06265 [Zetaproteobacteria bacterium CG_4_9_14_3_um_filter_49_83]|nr:MAG: hypothetical protein AUJ56_05345 [Zetaproteobacteria bacterium CG1_02_49_23]PIV31674.1 MAG: hypothetical protein COS35_00175 [Zetaproteobacteria bacterium CG02_land_8_20_14_3_00_50_9]PIY54713.1 MAG: hypothetical protein COZ00_13275 [Zetaproteobacteria bacterium CG_4_10_14_0_8_um_filter_49_80]PJA35363.1 MAG: hypothetical protein CO186_06265 [Zetaproteobacteria bacterium CG_4_9_14_3_um_filter_49_83]